MNKCKYCDSKNLYEQSRPPHVGLYCQDCNKFQTWVKQSKPTETSEIASEAQQKYALDLMRKWKQSNKPMTAAQAGAIIKVFKE